MAVGKHVIAQDTLSGGDEGIGINESADFGIVISALEIIESGLCGAGLATPARGYMSPTPQRGFSYEGKWVVFNSLVHS